MKPTDLSIHLTNSDALPGGAAQLSPNTIKAYRDVFTLLLGSPATDVALPSSGCHSRISMLRLSTLLWTTLAKIDTARSERRINAWQYCMRSSGTCSRRCRTVCCRARRFWRSP